MLKNLSLVLLALALVFGMVLTGCDNGGGDTKPEVPVIAAASALADAVYDQNAASVTKLTVTAEGANVLEYTYQWYSNADNSNSGGTAIGTAATHEFTPPVTTIGTTYYYCVVTYLTKTAVTRAVKIEVIDPGAPKINTTASQLANALYLKGAAVTALKVVVTETELSPDFTYQWYSNTKESTTGSTSIANTTDTYTPSASTEGVMYYYCAVTCPEKELTTNTRIVKIVVPIDISSRLLYYGDNWNEDVTVDAKIGGTGNDTILFNPPIDVTANTSVTLRIDGNRDWVGGQIGGYKANGDYIQIPLWNEIPKGPGDKTLNFDDIKYFDFIEIGGVYEYFKIWIDDDLPIYTLKDGLTAAGGDFAEQDSTPQPFKGNIDDAVSDMIMDTADGFVRIYITGLGSQGGWGVGKIGDFEIKGSEDTDFYFDAPVASLTKDSSEGTQIIVNIWLDNTITGIELWDLYVAAGFTKITLGDNFRYGEGYQGTASVADEFNGEQIYEGDEWTLKMTFTVSRDLEDKLYVGLVDTSEEASWWYPITWAGDPEKPALVEAIDSDDIIKEGQEITAEITLTALVDSISASGNELVFQTNGEGTPNTADSGVKGPVTINFTAFELKKTN